MKQLLILSGKGGTGKTNFASSFAILAADKAVVADCDVDASDMHLVLRPIKTEEEDFYSGYFAEIDFDKCTNCNKCISVCEFNAISAQDNQVFIDKNKCEGCGYCSHICPRSAIEMKSRLSGKLFRSRTEYDVDLIHAELLAGGENSGKLVSKVKKTALEYANTLHKELVIIDGSPGIGCPVTASLAGASYVVIITEPTLSAFYDLKRLYALINKMNIKAACIINKADVNNEICDVIKLFLIDNDIELIDTFDFDKRFITANRIGKPILFCSDRELKNKISLSWDKIDYNMFKIY